KEKEERKRKEKKKIEKRTIGRRRPHVNALCCYFDGGVGDDDSLN
ncbi:Uncharacterized protein APZ42_006245, partial [Daphnia magna]